MKKLFNLKSIVQSKARWLLTLIAILTLGIGQMWAYTATIYVVPEKTWGNNWSSSKKVKVSFRVKTDGDNQWWGEDELSPSGMYYDGCEIYSKTYTTLPNDGFQELWIKRYNGSTKEDDFQAYGAWADCNYWNGHMRTNSWVDLDYTKYSISNGVTIYFDNSDMSMSNVGLYLFKPGYSTVDNFEQISGTPYWKGTYSDGWSGYAGIIFRTQSDWTKQTANIYQNITADICFTPTSGNNKSGVSTTAPVGPKNIAISNTGSVVRGSGTEESPYVVAPGTAITQSVSADPIDLSTTLYYMFSAGSAASYSSSTRTNTHIASAVAGTSYTVYATVKTQKSSVDSRAFNSSTLYYTTAYAVTLNDNGGSGGDGTSYAVNGASAVALTNLPTKASKGFDGYWTGSDGTGTQVIDENGNWIRGVTGYTDGSGNWTCTGGYTLYARWLDTGYYIIINDSVAGTNNFLSGSPLKKGIYIDKTGYASGYSGTYTGALKIRKITTTPGSDVWYGKSASIGKGTPTASSLSYNNNKNSVTAITLQVYYTGTYTFEFNPSSPSVTVAVPVIDQLQIYSPTDGCQGNYAWGPAVSNIVTKTVALKASTTYTFKAVYDSEFWSKTNGSITRNSNSVTGITHTGGEGNLSITTDVAGDYTFELDMTSSSEKVTVTYPDKYTVTYGRSPSAAASAPTLDKTLVDGYIADGTTLTFTRGTINSGYTWKGWYDNSSGTGVALGTDNTCSVTMDGGNVTVYAVYTEDPWTVSVVSSSATAGSVGSSSVTGYYDTQVTLPTATPNTGYYFVNWEVTSGSASLTNASSADACKVYRLTADATVRANFAPIWALTGNTDEMGNWSSTAHEIENITTVAGTTTGFEELTLYPNRDYNFRIRDNQHDDGGNTYRWSMSGDMTYTNCTNWSLEANKSMNSNIKTAGYGTYRFTWNMTNKRLTVTYPPSSILTLGWGHAEIDALGTVTSGNTGGSVTAQTNEGSGYTITNNQYVASGSAITFTASPATGYRLEGWYTDDDYAVGHKISNGGDYDIDGNTLTVSDIDDNLAIYAKFVEKPTTVTITANDGSRGSITVGGSDHTWGTSVTAGVTTGRTLSVTAEEGFYFAGWTKTEGTDYKLGSDADSDYEEDSKTPTLKGKGSGETSGQTLTARFEPLEKVYFRNWDQDNNRALWSQVYVYFSISYEDHGGQCAKANSSADFKALMRQEGTSNVYWAYVPRATTRALNDCDHHIAFSNYNCTVNQAFYQNEGVMRGDYQAGLDMFVPQHGSNFTRNSTKYYKGYWKHHNVANGSDAKYYLKRYTGGTTYVNADDGAGHNNFTVDSEDKISFSLRVQDMAESGNMYRIDAQYGGIWYITYKSDGKGGAVTGGDKVTTTNCSNLTLTEFTSSTPTFTISPSSEGNYTLSIDMSGDVMKLSVNFAVAVGDYLLEHDYNDGSAKKSYSSIIKERDASGSTISMYLYGDHDKNGTIDGTLKLKRCTSISAGSPTWSDGIAVSGYTTANFKEGSGVYQFDIVINTTSYAVTSLTNADIYTGDYYIKTDYAPGGWVNYKSNVMEHNTINYSTSDTTTFDYYFCKYVDTKEKDGQRNVKCVIANDYNEQLTDTLIGDAVLGLDGGKPRQYLAADASVRFSYNSYTNKLKRAYMNGGSTSLKLHDAKILGASTASTIFNSEGGALASDQTGLSDLNNWVYTVDIQARETARYRLTADYNFNSTSHLQYLIGASGDLSKSNTKELIGGSASNSTKRSLRVIYDFKTNNLIAAWLVGSDIALAAGKDSALHTDLMIMRVGQGDAYQITFGSEAKFSNVKSIYGVMQLNKSYLLDEANYSQYARDLYWISFPFNVKLSDVFGFGTYGTHWIIEYYDGKSRAQNGFWVDSEPFWKFVTPAMRDTFVLKANEGYILAIDLDQVGESSKVWENSATSAYLYFPSQGSGFTIDEDNVDVSIDQTGYQCTIDRRTDAQKAIDASLGTTGDVNKNRTIADSYWHCIGIPSFANNTHATKDNWTIGEGTEDDEVDAGDYPSIENWESGDLLFVYQWNSENNSLVPVSATSFTFKPMQSYMVQYNGTTINWTAVSTPVAAIAARQMDTPDRNYCLQLLKDSVHQDQTFISLTDKAGVTSGFEFNYDLSKEMNKNRGNIWTLTTNGVQVAGNSMPHPLATTIVPVGVKIATAGEYTFTMPEGTNGGDVWLLDNQTGSRTNLGLMDYTVNLTAGTIDGRFSLEFPVQNVVTELENDGMSRSDELNDANDAVRKVFVGGRLYIIRDGKAYDATGAQVR